MLGGEFRTIVGKNMDDKPGKRNENVSKWRKCAAKNINLKKYPSDFLKLEGYF